jgi:hypothetical protein
MASQCRHDKKRRSDGRFGECPQLLSKGCATLQDFRTHVEATWRKCGASRRPERKDFSPVLGSYLPIRGRVKHLVHCSDCD